MLLLFPRRCPPLASSRLGGGGGGPGAFPLPRPVRLPVPASIHRSGPAVVSLAGVWVVIEGKGINQRKMTRPPPPSSGLLLALTSQLNFTSLSYHLVPQNKNIQKG